jgi:N-acetylmuramoyl-L-alanine amidase
MGVLSVILLIRKRILWAAGLFCCFFVVFAAVFWFGSVSVPTFAAREDVPVTVVIDPGHGGEDGGAVSADGVSESQINLAVSQRVNHLLRFAGQRTVMIRTEDVSVHTEGDTIRERKVSDIHHRVDVVNGTENAVLLSIHQNSLPSSTVTHGAQVFWNRQEGAETLARVVQDSLNSSVNAGNEKQPKKISDTIYLMKNVTAPAILVECGFLSNGEETGKLQEPSYQLTLAAAITTGYLRALAGEEVP